MARLGGSTLLVGLEVHGLHHHKVMPIDLGIRHALLLSLLLLFLSLALLELGPLHAIADLKRGRGKPVSP